MNEPIVPGRETADSAPAAAPDAVAPAAKRLSGTRLGLSN